MLIQLSSGKLDRRSRSTKLTIDQELYTEQCKRVNQLIYESKMKFYSDIINENSNDQQILFSCFGKMLNTTTSPLMKLLL